MRVLFCNSASPGHISPAIRLALQLTADGIDVAFLTDQPGDAIICGLGFKQLRSESGDDGFDISSWFLPSAIVAQTKQLVSAYKRYKPDLIVGTTFTLGTRVLWKMTSCPTVSMGLAAYLFTRRTATSSDPTETKTTRERVAWRTEDVRKHLVDAFQVLGLRVNGQSFEELFLCDSYMVRSVPGFDGDVATLPERVSHVGDYLWEKQVTLDQEVQTWIQAMTKEHKSIVYVQHARTFSCGSFWKTILECANNKNFAFVASVDRMDTAVGRVSPNIYIAPYVPQAPMMEICTAVICSGTTTPVLGAIRAAKPIVAVPVGGEQIDLATICLASNVARLLSPEDVCCDSLLRSLQEVIGDTGMARSAQLLADSFEQFERKSSGKDVVMGLAS